MKNNTPLLIGLLFGALIIGLVVFFFYNQDQQFQWYPRFEENGDQPYDLGLLNQQLGQSYQIKRLQKRVGEELPSDASAKGTSYLYIGNEVYYTEAEAERLMDYIRQGGKAFIATKMLPDSLIQFLIFGEQCSMYGDFWRGDLQSLYQERIRVNFSHPQLNTRNYEFNYVNDFSIFGNSWSYIPKERLCDEAKYPMATLGSMQSDIGSNPNFVRMRVGEGEVYFHTNPILFTNYYFASPTGFEYITKVFAHLSTETLYWDRVSSVPPQNMVFRRPPSNFAAQQSPMQYIYSQRGLRWAWYLLLSLGLVYVLFRAKRRQRIIPILEPNRNTSLEFVQTIAQLYFQQQDHKSILHKQMQQFLSHLRQRYHIVVREDDDTMMRRIAVRTAVSEETIKTIFDEYARISAALRDPQMQVSATTLNRFYLLIEKFHTEEAEKSKQIVKK